MFSGKVAIITGSAQGLGKAFSRALLEQGGKVCLSDVNPNVLEKTYEEFKAEFADNVISLPCDVTEKEQLRDTDVDLSAITLTEVFRKTKETFGGIDLVVNNAGIVHEAQWEKCIDVNLNGTIRGTQLGLEYLRKDNGGNGGVILNMASLAGLLAVNYTPVYCASKHAVIGYTRSWALHPDAVNNGVRLVCLCPAFVDTDMIKMDDKSKYIGPELAQSLLDKLGVMSIDKIIQVFLKAIEDETNNGDCITITKTGVNNVHIPRP